MSVHIVSTLEGDIVIPSEIVITGGAGHRRIHVDGKLFPYGTMDLSVTQGKAFAEVHLTLYAERVVVDPTLHEQSDG